MKILYISTFADPNPVNSNQTSVSVVRNLLKRGYEVTMLTCTYDPTWRGEWPNFKNHISNVPVLHTVRDGIPYLVIDVPEKWCERAPHESINEEAIKWGMEIIKYLKPDVVHLQQWQNLSWLLESAQKLKVPTAYSVNDYGLTCMRTFLIKGDGGRCDGIQGVNKCSECTLSGRGRLGYLNEILVNVPIFSWILNSLPGKYLSKQISKYGVVKVPAKKRAEIIISRSRRILGNIDFVTVGSLFGLGVMENCEVKKNRIQILPWFHNQEILCEKITNIPKQLVIGFVGRISPEKGLHTLLEELTKVDAVFPVVLKIAGGIDSNYGEELYSKYKDSAGKNKVEWLGWIPNEKLKIFYENISLTVVPSLCFETGPLSMIESLAHKRPVLCTDIAPMMWLNEKYGTGHHFIYNKERDLANNLEEIANDLSIIPKLSASISVPPDIDDYCNVLIDNYIKLTDLKKLVE